MPDTKKIEILEDGLYDNLENACWKILWEPFESDGFRHCVQILNTLLPSTRHLLIEI